jgi:hypothetical protein
MSRITRDNEGKLIGGNWQWETMGIVIEDNEGLWEYTWEN